MHTEYEAKFINIDKDDIRSRLRKLGASLIKPEFLQTRRMFHPPDSAKAEDGKKWVRVRDEGDRITFTVKQITGDKIDDQKEVEVIVDNFENACLLAESLGCIHKSTQEQLRELWHFQDVEFMIDTWPYLNPYLEIEGPTEKQVHDFAQKLGLNWDHAIFGGPDQVIHLQHGTPYDVINNHTPVIAFDQPNPWAAS